MDSKLLNSKLTFGQRLTLLFSCFILGLIMTTLFVLIINSTSLTPQKGIIISTVLQNVIAFILPAAITVVFISSNALQFLQLHKAPSLKAIAAMIGTYLVMIPAFNLLVDWNKGITFPESLSAIEQYLRAAENAAEAVTNSLIQNNGPLALILVILTVGVLTGFAEEVFFRGALLRIFESRPVRIHAAIWITAVVFSAMHMQFFGFFSRIVLGALFGYALWWSGSLWVPIIGHILNNSMVVILNHIHTPGTPPLAIDTIGITNGFPWLALASACATIALAVFLSRYFKRINA